MSPLLDELMRLTHENKSAHRELDDLRQEAKRVQRQMHELELEARRQDEALQSMQTYARANKAARKEAERQREADAKLASQALKKEKARNDSLERRIHNLEQAAHARASRGSAKLVGTLEKLIRKSPATGKKLAFVLHPDKHADHSDLSTEVFRWVMEVREGETNRV